jgi:hypothetical protein
LAQPLVGAEDVLPKKWIDGRRMADVAAEFIKPNDRLSSLERLQIYARCYWYRLIDSVYADCPALHAFMGDRKFSALVRGYLAKYPSRSWSLRDLCARLPQFIREEPQWTAPQTDIAHAIARFEWAQTLAFDGEARPRLTRDDIADAPPAKLKLTLQPYISLLELDWAIDRFLIAVKKRDALRGDASNTIDRETKSGAVKRLAPPKREKVYVVMHRHDERLYYKRVEPAAFRMLQALAAGKSLSRALGLSGPEITAQQVRDWFGLWMELGWFCRK